MNDLTFRQYAVRTLPAQIGCYALCDLDHVPIYVGSSKESIRADVSRHLISAQSNIVANRQVDIWEIAWVWVYLAERRADIATLGDELRYEFNRETLLMNGRCDARPDQFVAAPKPTQIDQVMPNAKIAEKKDPALRLPRQAEHYSQIVGHFLAVKNSQEIAGAIQAHFQRLRKYHNTLLGLAIEIEGDAGDD